MLEKLKMMLGYADTDEERDARLALLLDNATARLKILLGGIEPPEALEYILLDVAIARFNRIGSEGLTSHTVEGESLSFVENDFAAYAEDIQAFLATQEDGTRGRMKFL